VWEICSKCCSLDIKVFLAPLYIFLFGYIAYSVAHSLMSCKQNLKPFMPLVTLRSCYTNSYELSTTVSVIATFTSNCYVGHFIAPYARTCYRSIASFGDVSVICPMPQLNSHTTRCIEPKICRKVVHVLYIISLKQCKRLQGQTIVIRICCVQLLKWEGLGGLSSPCCNLSPPPCQLLWAVQSLKIGGCWQW